MKLLFICTGNLYRSVMAERLAESIGDRMGLVVEARSAGTAGLVDHPAADKAIAVCREVGLDLSDHRSQKITDELLTWADWVVVMEVAHATHVRSYFPDVGERLLQLGPLAGLAEIPDPAGGWTFQVRRVRRHLERGVTALLTRLGGR